MNAEFEPAVSYNETKTNQEALIHDANESPAFSRCDTLSSI